MGASTFTNVSHGKTAQDAFRSAVQNARFEHGHGGYTGTIAEKDSFTMIPLPSTIDKTKNDQVQNFIDELIDSGDSRIDDKWGPAGCIQVDKETFIFFGWASE